MKTLKVSLSDLENRAHGSITADTYVTVTARYSSDVVLTDGTIIPPTITYQEMTTGEVSLSVYASDDPLVKASHRGFGIIVTGVIRSRTGRYVPYNAVYPVKLMTADPATVELGALDAAGPLPARWATVAETISDFDNRLEVVEVATGTQYGNVPTLTNVTEVPSDVSGRVDLVYTRPTTVHFADPGLTDIVLSIEGYQHITWEGVSVHGTPSLSGVVWASAMWRDRDSTWHLLCEQDPSQSGGGANLRTFTWENFAYQPDTDASGNYVMLSGGRVSHSQKAGAVSPITEKLVTLSVSDQEAIVETSYTSQDAAYAAYALYSSMLVQSNSVSTVEGLPDGMLFQVTSFRITSKGVYLSATLAISTVPGRGRATPGSGFTLSIPKELLPPVGFYDTGQVTLPIPGLPNNPSIQINNTSSQLHGLNVSLPSTVNYPFPIPDPDTPGFSESQKEFAELGFHLFQIDQVFPYLYFSMSVDQT